MIFSNVEKEVEIDIYGSTAVIRPLSMVNNAFGFVTFEMIWKGEKYLTKINNPCLDISGLQIQVCWTEDGLNVTVLPEED